MSAWAQVKERDTPNSHVYPLDDVIEHRADPRCVCRPRWKAGWSPRLQSIVWVFLHSAADGRAAPW